MIRLALVADTHGYLDPSIAEVVRGCDRCVHAGDIGNAAVLDALQPRGAVHAVRGNNDTPRQWPASDLARLASLTSELRLALPGGDLIVVHGDRINPAAQRHARLRRRFTDTRMVVYGHSHRLVVDDNELPWVVNPGAAGKARTFGGPSCLVLEASRNNWRLEVIRVNQTT